MGWIGPLIQLVVMVLGMFMNAKGVKDEQKKAFYLYAKAMGMKSLVPAKIKQDLEQIFEDLDKE